MTRGVAKSRDGISDRKVGSTLSGFLYTSFELCVFRNICGAFDTGTRGATYCFEDLSKEDKISPDAFTAK